MIGSIVVVQKALSVVIPNDRDNAVGDNANMLGPQLNPMVVSMLSLPLLQIVSFPPQSVIVNHTHTDQDHTDCQAMARHLLTAVNHYTTQRHCHCRHGDEGMLNFAVLYRF